MDDTDRANHGVLLTVGMRKVLSCRVLLLGVDFVE
jgi:hypothetical protein